MAVRLALLVSAAHAATASPAVQELDAAFGMQGKGSRKELGQTDVDVVGQDGKADTAPELEQNI